jgi:hypothetical protein
MQTFLPYKDFKKSAECLDYKRLGKQRCEAWQILQCLLGEGSLSWKNHPAVKMWKGHEVFLCIYGMAVCCEWINRGYKDTMLKRFENELKKLELCPYPEWINLSFCKRHQSNLLRKNPKYYSKFKWDVPDNLEYIWPI